MQRIRDIERDIRDYMFQKDLYKRHFKPRKDDWNALCVGLDMIGDTTLALREYEHRGLGTDEPEKYLRLYGMLQAVYLQQDALQQVARCVTDQTPTHASDSFWTRIRDFRHMVTGHPTGKRDKQTGDTKRVYLNRSRLSERNISLIVHDKKTGKDEFPNVDLKALYEGYREEAIILFAGVRGQILKRWGLLNP